MSIGKVGGLAAYDAEEAIIDWAEERQEQQLRDQERELEKEREKRAKDKSGSQCSVPQNEGPDAENFENQESSDNQEVVRAGRKLGRDGVSFPGTAWDDN
jgi:hypothetical protein